MIGDSEKRQIERVAIIIVKNKIIIALGAIWGFTLALFFSLSTPPQQHVFKSTLFFPTRIEKSILNVDQFAKEYISSRSLYQGLTLEINKNLPYADFLKSIKWVSDPRTRIASISFKSSEKLLAEKALNYILNSLGDRIKTDFGEKNLTIIDSPYYEFKNDKPTLSKSLIYSTLGILLGVSISLLISLLAQFAIILSKEFLQVSKEGN